MYDATAELVNSPHGVPSLYWHVSGHTAAQAPGGGLALGTVEGGGLAAVVAGGGLAATVPGGGLGLGLAPDAHAESRPRVRDVADVLADSLVGSQ